MADPKNIRHGVYSTYTNLSCRCDECRAANARHQAEYRAKNKVKP